MVQMDMDIQEERGKRVILDFLAILVHKEKMVPWATQERKGQRASKGGEEMLVFLDWLELLVTKAHQDQRASRAPKVW